MSYKKNVANDRAHPEVSVKIKIYRKTLCQDFSQLKLFNSAMLILH